MRIACRPMLNTPLITAWLAMMAAAVASNVSGSRSDAGAIS